MRETQKAISFPNYYLMQYTALDKQNLSGNHRAVAPPDPIPNSEVKHSIADGSVGSPHARVGHFQAPNKTARPL